MKRTNRRDVTTTERYASDGDLFNLSFPPLVVVDVVVVRETRKKSASSSSIIHHERTDTDE